MNILFLTLVDIRSLEENSIYMDLMKVFVQHGHQVHLVSPIEKKYKKETYIIERQGMQLLKVQTGNLFQVGMLEKGFSQMKLADQYTKAIDRYWKKTDFDLILYSTPPIFLAGVVESLKKRTNARTYLLLKDIFPQNAVDIGLMKGWMAKLLFQRKEKELYQVSDKIGCMSPANAEYLLKHNTLPVEKVEICPNSIIPGEYEDYKAIKKEKRAMLCEKYEIPADKVLFLYGGNLGKPQDIPFLLRCMEAVKEKDWAYFIVCGNGTEAANVKSYQSERKQQNFKWISTLPKQEYEELAACCDVGMIFLDHRFTIPNFPSRLLSYMDKGLPVLTCTDRATDVGKIAEENGFGRAAYSADAKEFAEKVLDFKDSEARKMMGEKARKYLEEHYTAETGYEIIMKHM